MFRHLFHRKIAFYGKSREAKFETLFLAKQKECLFFNVFNLLLICFQLLLIDDRDGEVLANEITSTFVNEKCIENLYRVQIRVSLVIHGCALSYINYYKLLNLRYLH